MAQSLKLEISTRDSYFYRSDPCEAIAVTIFLLSGGKRAVGGGVQSRSRATVSVWKREPPTVWRQDARARFNHFRLMVTGA